MSTRILIGDVRTRLAELPDKSVQCVVTSPPYFGLRDYQVSGQIGLEPTLAGYIETLVSVFREVRRVVRDDGTVFLNLGDSYNAYNGNRGESPGLSANHVGRQELSTGFGLGEKSLKPKDLMMVPARVAIALQDDGWYLRSDIIWHKRAPMPESVTDRPTSAHEHIYLLTKSPRYFYDADAVAESTTGHDPGTLGNHAGHKRPDETTNGKGASSLHTLTSTRNMRNVWTLSPEPYADAHFATFPSEIPRRAIKAGTSERGACSVCGAPWSRATERESIQKQKSWNGSNRANGVVSGGGHTGRTGQWAIETKTTGWKAGCDHDAPIVPCIVLDCFAGAGTTAVVAEQLGRDCILIELNPEYAKLAENRVRNDAPMFNTVTVQR